MNRGKDNPTDEEIQSTYQWWCQVNGGWNYAVRASGDGRVLEQVIDYINVHGPQKLDEEVKTQEGR